MPAKMPESSNKGDNDYYFHGKWYGGFTYVDLLYPGVTEKFIRETMAGYEKSTFHHSMKKLGIGKRYVIITPKPFCSFLSKGGQSHIMSTARKKG